MKTEEWLRYERMYAEMRRRLGTPWLEGALPARGGEPDRSADSGQRVDASGSGLGLGEASDGSGEASG